MKVVRTSNKTNIFVNLRYMVVTVDGKDTEKNFGNIDGNGKGSRK
jgi:hypothetical protein